MKLNKTRIIRIILALVCIIIFFVLMGVNHWIIQLPDVQYGAERWENDSLSAQVSIFFPEKADFTTENIQTLHENIETELASKSLQTENSETRLWYDSYSTEAGQMEIKGNRKNSAKALVTAVGGDFFLLHAMQLVSGGYFSETDLMHDRVVMDTQLAWQLFGSSDVAGMEIQFQNETFLVAGVVQPETDYASRKAYGTMPRMYVPYTCLTKEKQTITCYEAVFPNPVKNFAMGILENIFSEEEKENSVLLQNTGRYALSERWKTLRHIHELLICDKVIFPYWENTAKIISFDTAIILLFQIILLIYPIIYGIFLLSKTYLFLNKMLHQKRLAWKNRYRSEIKQI